MKVLDVLWRSGFDYHAVFNCEFCGSNQVHENCYSDDNFSTNVIPAIRCVKCNKRTDDLLPEERFGDGIPVKQISVTNLQWVKE